MAYNKKITNIIKILRYLPWTLYFNFKFLPFNQAIKLPVLLYKPQMQNNTGKYIIRGKVSYGMIRLGFPTVSIFPNTGIILENRGTIVFQGKCKIGNNSAISLGEKGYMTLGNGFVCSTGLKLICYNKVDIGEVVRIGWNVVIMDTDFHSMKLVDSTKKSKGYGPISIGNHIWIGSFCKIYKHSVIPDWCTVSSNTIVKQPIVAQSYSVIYNPSTTESKYIGRYRDPYDDKIMYE